MTGSREEKVNPVGETGDGGGAERVGRRALMLGAAVAGAGAAVSLVAAADPAGAANGGNLLLGESNSAKATTEVTSKAGNGLEGVALAEGLSGLYGSNTNAGGGYGVYGTSLSSGVYGVTTGNGGVGVFGVDDSPDGAYGAYATSTNGVGVYGTTTGDTEGLPGVWGDDSSTGGGAGVTGDSTNGIGVYGSSINSYGVYAYSEKSTALYVDGGAKVVGSLSKGGGSFQIDHPLDPEHKYLYHSFVESPDMMNVYNGTVVLDALGRASVELPDWFEALNRDYRYQLTAIGGPAPDLHISSKVEQGTFAIAGGGAGQEVSWQVTGIRQDAWANANRIPVEVEKPLYEQGGYLYPALFKPKDDQEVLARSTYRRRSRPVVPPSAPKI